MVFHYFKTEKEKEGPQFSAFSLDVPVPMPAHQLSTLCVSLPFGHDLTSILADQDTDKLCAREQQVGVESGAEKISKQDKEELPCPLEKYKSQLLHFKSYR